ncbi:DUF732 domain-containing protein [Mycolicibacterium bacteremicum]|uniref:DUF732 domain-containing protein n=1 Tax=Mycolicibacterium bacteremicum TaxID=564198 RepID=UPI0026E93A9D|nr:DUF732 domain-containing protein [Mycolicibacterium bacteremicum]
MSSTTRLLQLTGLALAAGTIGLCTSGAAGAVTSAADSAFLADLRAEGIGYESAGEVIANAYQVCSELDSDVSATDIGLDIMDYTGVNARQAAAFIVNSVDYYCPEHAGAFG